MRRKVIKLSRPKEEKEIVLKEKVPLEKLREIWDDEETVYTEAELLRIRDWLYAMAEVILRTVKKSEKENRIIQLNTYNNESEKSNFICESEYRRAS